MTVRARRRTATVLLAAALAPGLATVPVFAEPAAAVSACRNWTDNEPAGWYQGLSAGAIYDRTFRKGPLIPGLPTFTPQGIAVIPNWNSSGDGLLLIGAHNFPFTSRIFGVNTRTGYHVGTIEVAESHLGGMAVVGDWLFTQSGGVAAGLPQPVRKYPLSEVRAAMRAPGVPFLAHTGETQTLYGAAFMATEGQYLWSGRFSLLGDRMHKYAVAPDGTLTQQPGEYRVPPRTQGLLVTGNRFIFSTSDGALRGRMFVTRKTGDYATAAGRCFRIPSLAQGLAAYRGTVYLNFEGGAFLMARNRIKAVHKASLSTLSSLN